MPRSRKVQKLGILLVVGFLTFSVTGATEVQEADPSPANVVYVLSALLCLFVSVVGFGLWVARRRVLATRLFSLAMALNLLVVQLFHLLDQTFAGFVGVLGALFVYVLARSMLYRAEHAVELAHDATAGPGSVAAAHRT
jgi:sterol desaturase/sphingolipid hydroxylase (fatty acid hydroxylase superfamily)